MVRRHRSVGRLAVGAGAAGLALAAGLVALTGPWDGGQRAAERDQAEAAELERGQLTAERLAGGTPAAPAVLSPLDGSAAAPSAEVLTRVLTPLLEADDLGEEATGSVIDVSSGAVLFERGVTSARAPASTVKVVTAAAALDALGPHHQLTTRTVVDADAGRVFLVGGGDTTLTASDLQGLADRTARALAGRDLDSVTVAYDVSAYAAETHPIGVNTNIAPITPLQVNAGRLDDSTHGPAERSTDPAKDAARTFAERLVTAGIDVEGRIGEATAPEEAAHLAEHRSAPVASLVERMLTDSDNDLAEALARVTAVASDEPGTAGGVARALTGRAEALGAPLESVRIADASGLDRESRVTAGLLTAVLAAAADPERPELRPALTGLPVAGFTGTLTNRYDEGNGAGGAGVVRAKTGTLTGVNTLAGTATTADGRVLAFAFMAADTRDAAAAQEALDTAASALASLSVA
ncbi:D-alanyl-D-alanine carboxypeptidase / D-alanyl-D-alanine-endopeptidase (penicillin-binding protein 4) [Streptomyces zhaozhouensis]|uniref:D-alanyl-D-alanine carboxypeptidase / D-alanyl-D-alanine-endopeptidase (Penicillin-binding protein 4) n=1 Tax=Streptomyces zhaozhouensis TaxID=1300267 RepID=A0A286DWW3_9ACTN|nr:D-alanyl-D-alanine carboxypeptidase/D-alanyl-D-alanine-endopeptidase [Streptomyces zhaozhouensis]SOD63123.1 D-alanyl-D-alanine carboxypeptidase / D-alanyl-D-alanine-endopeptidase (penicillin-binding protein 4) [Streptomyces zhaozhouensis]